jgi:hypothetical protein
LVELGGGGSNPPFGESLWEAGAIPYESQYTGNEPSMISVAEYVETVVHPRESSFMVSQTSEEGNQARIPYIFGINADFVDHETKQKRGEVGMTALFPQLPDFFEDTRFRPDDHGQFYLGSPGTGAPIHHHNEAFNALVFGRKGWVLTYPSTSAFSNVPAKDMVQALAFSPDHPGSNGTRGRRGGRRFRFVQNAGDMVVLPSGWGEWFPHFFNL